MLEKLTHKQRFIGLIIVSVMFIIVAFKRSYSGAIQAASGYYSAKSQLVDAPTLQQQYNLLTASNLDLDAHIGNSMQDAVLVQNAVLEFAAELPVNTQVTAVAPMHSYTDSYFTQYSNKITMSGTFNQLLESIYAFEKDFNASRISHVTLYTQKNFKTRKNELFTDILFQHYEQH